jgi:hypothetical protein
MLTAFKIFENKEQEFWLFDYYIKNESHYYCLYPDKESVEIAILDTINEERSEIEEGYTNDMYFTDVKDALKWYEDNFNDIIINYEQLELSEPLKPSEKLKMMRNTKKYNL